MAELSQGMKQRARLASLMLYNPRLIILDDPSTGSDLAVKEDLIYLFCANSKNLIGHSLFLHTTFI
jgi:energy-coupling factor transporter ATP-binding protein EcfA2